jgi:hypothetical protein
MLYYKYAVVNRLIIYLPFRFVYVAAEIDFIAQTESIHFCMLFFLDSLSINHYQRTHLETDQELKINYHEVLLSVVDLGFWKGRAIFHLSRI